MYVAIANDALNGKVNVALIDNQKHEAIMVGQPASYEVNREYTALSRAMVELEKLEGTMASIYEMGYQGKVFVTCAKGLALKISACVAGREIYQDFMDSAEGPWGEYVARIKELVNDAKKAGMILSGTPALNLRRSEIAIDDEYELIEDGIKIGGEEFHDGDVVTFTKTSKNGENYRAEFGPFSSSDVFVHGERELHIVHSRDGKQAFVDVIRFAEDTEDKLPDTAYGDQISWLRYVMQASRASLREGRAPRAKKAAA